MLSNITFLMIFCGFLIVAANTMDKLQFLVFLFAVLLSKLCNVSLCNYRICLSSFSILKISVRYVRLSKIKTLTLHRVLETNMRHRIKFRNGRSNRCGYRVFKAMTIDRFSMKTSPM